ncbi:MAG: helix-turn-helix transcriptional regulator, partial [Acidobacteriaceae bacterium]
PVHGHAIAKSIESRSGEVLQIGHGSLYPALQRLIKRGLLSPFQKYRDGFLNTGRLSSTDLLVAC